MKACNKSGCFIKYQTITDIYGQEYTNPQTGFYDTNPLLIYFHF